MFQIPAWESYWKKLLSPDPSIFFFFFPLVRGDGSSRLQQAVFLWKGNTLLMGTDSSLTTLPKQHPQQRKASHITLSVFHLK